MRWASPTRSSRPIPCIWPLAADSGERQEAYRALFRTAIKDAPLADLRLALNQNQPLANDRFYAEIEAVTGQRREPRKRGRLRKRPAEDSLPDLQQHKLPL